MRAYTHTHIHTHTMKVPLLFFCLPLAGMCSVDGSLELEARQEELLSSLFRSKVGVYLWMAALRTVCGRIPWLDGQGQEAWPRYSSQLQLIEGLYYLQKPCRVLYLWETGQDDLAGQNRVEKKSNNKRKSLRRQFHASTARKPYLLK
ncbi:hypothetical protein COCON_G00229380 [Conger conger]|uniref:Neurotensin/neuromedin N n=1 Tax=Conger conger TaxID=82655 RepID=A0A9Q1HLY6_CONCO|nr:hypothetical protein COCON_G00229380 [Conger conger]